MPASANRFLFLIAPLLSIVPALATWAVIPLFPGFAIARDRCRAAVRAGADFAWRLRRDSRRLGLELEVRLSRRHALGRADCRLRDRDGFRARRRADGGWQPEPGQDRRAAGRRLPELVLAAAVSTVLVYFISGVAETNRAPFDVAEGESEIVAGFHVEYSGVAFAIFFLAEYANIILIAALTAVMFFGGWESFFAGPWLCFSRWHACSSFCAGHRFGWLCVKIAFFLFCFLWLGPPFPATAMTRSCGLAGRSLFRSPSSGSWSRGSWWSPASGPGAACDMSTSDVRHQDIFTLGVAAWPCG